jgi:glycosyltransferase involved in cell wall biosynthesis
MKIVYVSHYFSPEIGAPSARIYEMAQAWIRAGHQVEVITGFPNHPQGEIYPGYQRQRYAQEKLDGILVHRVWTYITPNKGLIKRTLGHISLWFSALLFASKHIKNPDVVIGTSPTLFSVMAARRLAIRYKAPFVMEVRDLWPGIFVDLGVIKNLTVIKLLEAWELWMYRQADKVVTVTDGFRSNIIERGIDPEKIHTVPNGADLDFFQPGEKSPSLTRELDLGGKFVILYLGAHSVSQGLDVVLDAALELSDMEDIAFLLVGDGNKKEQLLERGKSEKIDNLIFHPPISKDLVPSYYNLADICLVPLRDVPLFDTFIPSKMFEIMAMGKPILASLSGEAARILESSEGAVVIGPEDAQGIVQAIRDLYNDRQRRNFLGQKGRRFVEGNYSRKSLAAKYLTIMQEGKQ